MKSTKRALGDSIHDAMAPVIAVLHVAGAILLELDNRLGRFGFRFRMKHSERRRP